MVQAVECVLTGCLCTTLSSSSNVQMDKAAQLILLSFMGSQVDSRQIERKAQAAQQSMARRAQRLEKAQAAAVQAQLAARQMQRQSSQQKDQQQPPQPGRATLQQVSPCITLSSPHRPFRPRACPGGCCHGMSCIMP